ncbi:lipid kinase [filamentous cyanobacterium CCP5]|nr:lipid kinase [filamentous cyanobacterium CCP5]
MASSTSSDSAPAINDSKSYHLIFNPISGQQDPGPKLTEIQSALEDLNFTAHLTKPDRDAHQLAQQALKEGADVIIAAGGDGTVSGVASVLVGTDIPLGIIPSGTANGFASALGIPEDLDQACAIIKADHRSRVDTARCNDQLMLLVACIGFEANLLDNMDRDEKNILGKLAIVKNGLQELRDLEQFDVQLSTPDHHWNEPATAITIANTATAEMVLAQGPADVAADDRSLSVTLISPDHQWEAITSAADLLVSALQQRSVEDETVHHCKTSEVTVETDPAQKIFIDGEPAGETPIRIECHPKSLVVLTPPPQ